MKKSPTRALLACDKFKDALSAEDACAILADVITTLHPEWEVDLCSFTDGGDGFAQILTTAIGGQIHRVKVRGPLGRPRMARFGMVAYQSIPAGARRLLNFPSSAKPGRIAVIELAEAAGLAIVPPAGRSPMITDTRGVGDLLKTATQAGAVGIVLGLGGSATNDLGLGALCALGLKLVGPGNRTLAPAPGCWPQLIRIEGRIHDLPPLRIACDVANPLLGKRGAAAVYGPQKGLRPSDYGALESESSRIARLLCSHFGQPHSLTKASGTGAAGGTAFGLICATRARLIPGADLVAAWLDLDARIKRADLVVSGEGKFDRQSFNGKGPGKIVKKALALGKQVHVFCGEAGIVRRHTGFHLHQITLPDTPLAIALRNCALNLIEAARRVFDSTY